MKFIATIVNGTVTSILAVEDAGLTTALQSGGVVLPYGSPVQVGWGYDGQVFIPPPLTLQQKQTDVWADIKAFRDFKKFNGVLVSGKWIHTDTYSRTQWMAMVMMGAALPVIPWTTMDGSTINTTPALANAVFQGVAAQDATIFGVASWHNGQMMALSDPTGYDFSASWPVTFTQ